MAKVSNKISWEIVKKSFLPTAIFALLIGCYIFYRIKIFPAVSPEFHQALKKYVSTAFAICIAFIIHRIAGAVFDWYKETIASKTKTRLDDQLIPIFRRTFKVIIWSIALLIILPFYGVNISALIAALGVGSLAIALAAQDTIANVIAGFLIMIDVPFKVGDKIKIPSGEIVKVLDIGVRRSKFLAEDKAIIIVPNLDLSKHKIVNYTYTK
ncbi:MAG: mechanosensitive ion channel [Candidatus Omnitrophica bacterium]|nr:mechanosensitive ion channel [Candidatus Omnitrophota bacterium]